jgi:hypothetical protein
MSTAEEKTPSTGRRWLAVVLATMIMLLSYLLFIYSYAALSGEEVTYAGGLAGIAFGLVPGVFIVCAWVSQNPRTIRSAAAATGLWLVVTLPLAFVDLPAALVAGFGAGGAIAFHLYPHQSRRARLWAVAICVVYTVVLQRVSPELGLFAGAPLPFVAIMLADIYSERGSSSV